MNKISIACVLSVLSLIGCMQQSPVLLPIEYTITDTSYVARNGFGQILSYDVIVINHYDSLYYSGTLSKDGMLIRLSNRPIRSLNKLKQNENI
jgi:hypothetical protein